MILEPIGTHSEVTLHLSLLCVLNWHSFHDQATAWHRDNRLLSLSSKNVTLKVFVVDIMSERLWQQA